MVESGAAKLYRRYAGYRGVKEFAVALGTWDYFGRLSAVGGGEGWERAVALSACEVAEIPAASVRRAVLARPELGLLAATVLESVLSRHEMVAGDLFPRRTEERLARALLRLAERFGRWDASGAASIRLRLTRQDLAEMTAATRETVSFALNEL